MKTDPAFDAKSAAKRLLREARSGAIATLRREDGGPYCSLVNVATEADGTPLLLLSRLALHTKNILADPRISLMLDERKTGDPLEGARIMLIGRAQATTEPQARARYLARQPEAQAFAGFSDFAFYRMVLEGAHLVAGFGRIVDLAPADILIDVSDARALLDAEADAAAHMNTDHAEAVRLYATKLLGAPEGEWRCAGCDPEGLDLQSDRLALRLTFPQRVTNPAALRETLKKLAEDARGA
jgi:putative heme iron utilization protein